MEELHWGEKPLRLASKRERGERVEKTRPSELLNHGEVYNTNSTALTSHNLDSNAFIQKNKKKKLGVIPSRDFTLGRCYIDESRK